MNKSDLAYNLGKALARSRTPEEFAIPVIQRLAKNLYWKMVEIEGGIALNPEEKPATRRARLSFRR
jgi:hypothetical protein